MPKTTQKNRTKDRFRLSRMAVASTVMLLAIVFLWVAFRAHDRVLISFISTILALTGYILGSRAMKRIERHHGTIQGDGAALVGKWGCMILFILSAMYFSYVLAMAVYVGRFL